MGSEAQTFWKRVKELFHLSKREVIKTTVIGKAMIEESQLENKKRALLRELGELTLEMYKKGEIKNKQVESFCRKINVVINRIDEKESTIDNVKSGKTT